MGVSQDFPNGFVGSKKKTVMTGNERPIYIYIILFAVCHNMPMRFFKEKNNDNSVATGQAEHLKKMSKTKKDASDHMIR
jgi:hypothetical protein